MSNHYEEVLLTNEQTIRVMEIRLGQDFTTPSYDWKHRVEWSGDDVHLVIDEEEISRIFKVMKKLHGYTGTYDDIAEDLRDDDDAIDDKIVEACLIFDFS